MKLKQTILIVCWIAIGLAGGRPAFAQERAIPKPDISSTKEMRKGEKKSEFKADSPEKRFESPFRYVIVSDRLRYDVTNVGEKGEPYARFVRVLIQPSSFNKANLTYLFKHLAIYYAEPLNLSVEVHSSLQTLETLEESVAISTHSSRDKFRELYKVATYTRSNNVYDTCDAGFLYDTGKPGHFVTKFVRLPCTLKKQ